VRDDVGLAVLRLVPEQPVVEVEAAEHHRNLVLAIELTVQKDIVHPMGMELAMAKLGL
jgi:hypothetical protein